MDQAQDLLFGRGNRRVGTPNQHWVWSGRQVESFVESVNGEMNAYATLGWWDFDAIQEGDRSGESVVVPAVCDKVLYDFDSPAKASEYESGEWKNRIFPSDPPDDEAIDRMRTDGWVADEILGQVCDEVNELARRSLNDNVPIIGVYSGFGVHVHQLWTPTMHPATAMTTTANRYIDKLDLSTPDPSILGQPERLCRVPNCERVANDGAGTGLYTVPLSAAELTSVSPQWLLDVSDSQRDVSVPGPSDRTEMPVWDNYETGHEDEAEIPPRPLNVDKSRVAEDDAIREIMAGLLRMPCMIERLLDDPNPDHDVRANATVLLLNTGLNPQTVVELYQMVNWVDFDREKTREQVLSIYRSGYSDKSCWTLRNERLCVQSENPQDCSCYGWSGGQAEWKQ